MDATERGTAVLRAPRISHGDVVLSEAGGRRQIPGDFHFESYGAPNKQDRRRPYTTVASEVSSGAELSTPPVSAGHLPLTRREPTLDCAATYRLAKLPAMFTERGRRRTVSSCGETWSTLRMAVRKEFSLHFLRMRLFLILALLVAAAFACGLIMLALFQQSATAQIGQRAGIVEGVQRHGRATREVPRRGRHAWDHRFVLSRVHQSSRSSLPRSPNVGPLLRRVYVGLREDKPAEQVRRELKA